MTLVCNAKNYTADSFGMNAVSYNGPSKTATVKDNIVMRKIDPKPTDVFSGVTRTECKLTRTVTLTGAKTPSGDLIIQVLVSDPVGAAAADIDTALNDVGALVASATFKTHVKTPQISF